MSFTRRESLKSRLLSTSAAALLTFPAAIAGSGAFAQDQDQDQDQAINEVIEEVVVTGSRIRRAGFDTLQPAVQVDADFVDERGFTNVAQALNEVPAFGIPGTSNTGGQSSLNLGQNFVNAFGLGSQRTLTLINGRRTVGQNTPTAVGTSGRAGQGLQVDLNIIPTALIERVETIFIGGSPIYGSDAVAATVNVILKDDFEGLNVESQFGIAQRGDAESFRVRGLWGGNFADGRGNATIAAEFVTQKKLDGVDRQRALDGYTFCTNPDNTGPDDGIVDNIFCKDGINVWQVPNGGMVVWDEFGIGLPAALDESTLFGDSGAGKGEPFAGTLRNADGDALLFGPEGDLITFSQANVGAITTIFFNQGSGCGTNPNFTCLPETNTLISPLDRWIVSGNAHYQITENVRAFVETLYTRSESIDTNNQPPWSTTFFGPGVGGALRINVSDNPFVSQELLDTLALPANDGVALTDPETGDDYIFLTRSNRDIVEGNPNRRLQNVGRIVTGLEGDLEIFGNVWDWDAYYGWGISDASTSQTVLSGDRYAYALDVVIDPETGQPACRVQVETPDFPSDASQEQPFKSVDTAIVDCVPFNPFGVNQFSPELRDYLVFNTIQTSQIRQQVMEANIAGDLLQMPAGPLGFAMGVTHRRENASFNTGIGGGVGLDGTGAPTEDTAGKFNTYEVYAETVLPVISGGEGLPVSLPFIDQLDLEGALRFVDNSRAGNDVTWTAGGRMRFDLPLIGSGLQLRGNFTQSIRSPSVTELFQPNAQLFTFAQDPCDPRFIDGGPVPSTRRANCEAEFAEFLANASAPTVMDLDNFTSVIVNASQRGFISGNPGLKNEVADSWTIGGVITPDFLPGLTVSIDWTSIVLNDAIVSLTGSQLMRACYDNTDFPESLACSLFTREANTFQVFEPRLPFLNAAVREFSGLVANLEYTTDLAELPFLSDLPGTLQISGNFFHTHKHEQTVGLADLDTFAGEQGFEKFRMQLNARYSLDRLSLLWQVLHINSGNYSNENTDEFLEFFSFPAYRVHNLNIRYQLTDSIAARLVINNVFDNIDSPRLAASIGGNANLFNDIVGRRFVFGVSADF